MSQRVGLSTAPQRVHITCNPCSLFSISFKPPDIIIRILSGSNPLGISARFYRIADSDFLLSANHLFLCS